MNFTFTIALILSLASVSLGVPATEVRRVPDISNRYIVKLRPKASLLKLRSRIAQFDKSFGASSTVSHEYRLINGLAGKFDRRFINQLKQDKDVEYVVPDGIATIVGDDDEEKQDAPPSWGLTRVSQRKLNLAEPYVFPSSGGSGVDVYVVDTGVQDNHDDFEKRAKQIKSFVTGEAETDLNGHGTHCAGTIGSKTYGVAKKANIFGVKVLNSWGSGTWAGVIAGIDFVASDFKLGESNPRVMSMSLGGGLNKAVNDAVDAAAAKGVVSVNAAGNSATDTCQFSPAGAPGGLAVGATDRTDQLSSYSNRGKCTGILAPGSDITSLWKGANGATNTISGTSMACPHVAGLAALYLGKNKKYTGPKEVFAALIDASTKDTIVLPANSDTPNRLAFNARKLTE